MTRVFDPATDTELDFFVEGLRTLLRLDREARAFARLYPNTRNVSAENRDAFRAEMNAYFRLQPHMDTWAVFWELLRLDDLPAGSLGQE